MTQTTGPQAQLPRWMEISFEEIRFQDLPALFTPLRVKTGDIPEGLHRYEIREEDGEFCQLAKHIFVNHYGTLLTSNPIQLPADGYLSFSPEELDFLSGARVTPEDFLHRHPPTGRDVMELFHAKSEEAPLFFSRYDGQDAANGCIGHMRGDFEGDILHHTWWPHAWDTRCNDSAFQADLTRVVDWLRTGFAPLKSLKTMEAFCAREARAALPEEDHVYGFRIETKGYRYMLRCTPIIGVYHVYLYCYCKEVMNR